MPLCSLTECEGEVINAQKSLSDDLTQFFRNVELYRDGVFSHTTKESISTLGIGAQLDALELEFTDSDKAAFTAEAQLKLFPDFGEVSANALTAITSLNQRIRPLAEAIKGFKISSPTLSEQSFVPVLESEKAGLLSGVSVALQKDIDELSRKLEVRLSGALVETRSRYEMEIARARKDRRSRYISAIFATGAFAILCYVGYLYLAQDAGQSIFWVLGWGALANLIGDAVGYTGAKLLDKFPETTSKIREKFEVLFRRTVSEIIEEETKSHGFDSMKELQLTEQINQAYRRVMASDPDGWHPRAAEHIRQLREVHSEYQRLWSEYIGVIEEVVEKVSSYFSDATKNLASLNDVASRIKQRAIEPSFSLLERTRESLDQVKRQIQTVEFS